MLSQRLVESVALSLRGDILGIALGRAALGGSLGIPFTADLGSIMLAFLFRPPSASSSASSPPAGL
jgi:hypothetical protein